MSHDHEMLHSPGHTLIPERAPPRKRLLGEVGLAAVTAVVSCELSRQNTGVRGPGGLSPRVSCGVPTGWNPSHDGIPAQQRPVS